MNTFTRKNKLIALLLSASITFAGCGGGGGGGGDSESAGEAYARGFDIGFLDDSEYFLGYDDSFFTVGNSPILYSGDLIPFSDELTYQAGVWDGQFEAYNDGYFVAYRFAFIIGFSEGYDNAFASDFLDFLANDFHTEYQHGGFSDGYNDGFSEGRIFGAFDYEAFLAFDWLDAYLDWESGTDLYFMEVDLGTGELGPVELYEYAFNPHTIGTSLREESRDISFGPTMRYNEFSSRVDAMTEDATREFSIEQEDELSITPTTTSRTNRDLTINSTWLDRINAYLSTPTTQARPDQTNRSEMKRPE
jgi:hypothetical protein